MRGGSLATAVTFLTRLPLRASGGLNGLSGATGWFPLVGIAVGGAAAGAYTGANAVWGPVVAAVVAVATGVALTGAFHEDGLADTCDGLWGGWTADRRLEIMRDSRLGTYGAVALVIGLGLRVALLASVGPGHAARALVMGHTLGRFTVLPLVARFPAARHEGQAARVAGPAGIGAWSIATATVVTAGAVTIGVWAVPVGAAALAAAWLIARLADRRIGGITGDVLGAANQVAHVITVAVTVGLARHDLLAGHGIWDGVA